MKKSLVWIYSLLGVIMVGFSFFLFLEGVLFLVEEKALLFDILLLSIQNFDLVFEVMVDWLSLLFMGTILFISGSVMIYCQDYMGGDMMGKRFIMLSLMFILSMLIMVSSGGITSILLGWDGLGLTSYVLVIYYNSSSSCKAGMITMMTNRVGDVAILLIIGMMMMKGSWNYLLIENEKSGWLVYFLILVAGCTKSAQIPFSAWLPEAMAAPTPVSALVHSSTLVTAGVFVFIRFNVLFHDENIQWLLMLLSLMTMLLGGLGGVIEKDLKKVVAMSTLSQLGLMMFSLSMGMWSITFFHMLMHAFFKALMFMCVGGILLGMNGDQDVRFMSGKFKVSPLVNQGLLISVLCLSGFPFFCGFYSKDMSLEIYMMKGKGMFESLFFLMGFVMSMFYGLRLYLLGSVNLFEEKVFESFFEKKFINMGITFSIFMSVSGGSGFMWMTGGFMLIKLFFMMKIMSLLFLVFFIGFIISNNCLYTFMVLEKKNLMGNFIGNMWNYSILTGKIWINLIQGLNNIYYDDFLWMDEVGGGGMKVMLIWLISVYEKKLSEFFISFLMSSMFFLFLML